MAGEEFLLSGDQIATYSDWSSTYPAPSYTPQINLIGVQTLGSASDRFFLVRTQGNNLSVTNGDLYNVYPAIDDGTGTLVPDYTSPLFTGSGATPDAFNDTGAGDNYSIFGLYTGPSFLLKLDGIGSGTSISFVQGEDVTGNNGELELSEIAAANPDGVVCFANGTLIETRKGKTPVEDLRVGDCVLTYGGDFKPIRWIGSRKIHLRSDAETCFLRPIRILAGSLGQGLPSRDMLVSRQHRMLVSSKIAMRMFQSPNVLVSAIKLTALPGIFIDQDAEEVTYFHFLFDTHEIVFAEDAPAESLFTGVEALKRVSPAAREEIFSLFPELRNPQTIKETAFTSPIGRHQKQLIERHLKNGKPLLEAFRM